jgi:hypothetical protein
MFDDSLVTGSSSIFNLSNNLHATINGSIETSDLITSNPISNKFSSVGESHRNIGNYRLASAPSSNLFNSQSLENRSLKTNNSSIVSQQSVDSVTGKALQSTLVQSDDSLTGARDLSNLANSAQTINDSLSSSDLNDYYRFRLTSTSNFSLSLDGLSADANVQLLDGNGRSIQTAANTGTNAESMSRKLSAGNYSVRVYANSSNSTNYTLNLSAAIADGAGNALSSARSIGTLSGSKTFSDFVGSSDSNDYYRFSVSDPGSLNLTLNGLSANADVQLLDRDGNMLQSSANTGKTAESINVTLNTGDYFVRVFPNGSANTNYTMNLAIDSAGNALSSARSIGTLSGSRTFSDFVGSRDTNDYYRFSVSDTSNLNLALNGLSANADVQLLDRNGNVLQSSANTGKTAESINATLNAGDYFVRVFPNGSANTNYNLSLTATASPVDTAGNSLTNARNLGVLNNTQTINDFVGTTDTDDYYRFSLSNNSNFNLTLAGLSADADLQLLDRNGNIIKSSLNGGTTAELIDATLNAGDYFVRVFPYGRIDTNYSLNLTATPIITPSPDPITSQWYAQNLLDIEIRDLAQNLATDSQLNRNDMIAIFRIAADGSVISADELRDLRTIIANANNFNIQDHVRVLSNKVVNGNVANQKSGIGNLSAGSSDVQMENLIGKWFLGSDRPITMSSSHTYREVSGSLFQNGISAEDIRQGQVGDCYYLATLSSIALEKPSYIQDMFIDNGDNTFSVRFFNNGVADYVTVDRFLPTDSWGRLVYASAGANTTNTSNELWVALAEKAYAQLAESGWSRSADSTDSYAAIEGGWMDTVMKQITALSTSEGYVDGSAFSMTKQQLIDLVNSNKLLTAGFVYGGSDKIVNYHAYTITSYDSVTDTFFLRNPWGSQHASVTWNELLNLKAIIQWTNV